MRENLIRACYGGYTKQTKTKNLSGANYRIVERREWVLPFRFDCFLLRRGSASLYSASVKKPDPEQHFFSGAGRVSLASGAFFAAASDQKNRRHIQPTTQPTKVDSKATGIA